MCATVFMIYAVDFCHSFHACATQNRPCQPATWTRIPRNCDLTLGLTTKTTPSFFQGPFTHFIMFRRHWQSDQNRSWLQRECYKAQWNRYMNLHNNHLYTWVLLIGRVFTVCNLTSLQKLFLKITLNNASRNKYLTPVCGKLVSSRDLKHEQLYSSLSECC